MTASNSSILSTADVIDTLVGIRPGDALDALREWRPQARLHAQQSHRALFEAVPADASFGLAERFAVAAFVAGLHGLADVAAFYAEGLSRHEPSAARRDAIAVEAGAGAARGPYGVYPAGPLSVEDTPGPFHCVDASRRALFGTRLSAALAHAHLLVLHPRDARSEALQALLDAGWSTTDIVTLSQLVAFLSFQVRVATGLRALAATAASTPSGAQAEHAVA
jgi:CMD domain protein